MTEATMTHVLATQAEPGAVEIANAAGDYVTDADGKRYIDLAMGWCVGNLGWK
jgi:glutamate-1-semialdehyde aminotransferase